MTSLSVTPLCVRLRSFALVAGASLALLGLATPVSAQVIVSQVYGGGGNAGGLYRNDFIELRNTGSSAVSLAGWSVQYAASTGTTWQRTNLSGSIPAGGYYLVQQAAGADTSQAALPTPDAIGSIAMSSSAGKVALVNNQTTLTGSCPLGGAVVDFVGFGSATNCSETAPTANLSNGTAALRPGDACTDTNNNAADFQVSPPVPRNSTVVSACNGAPPPGPALVAIPAIQGSGATSPLLGQTVSTRGVVTRLNSNGFFIQDLTGDGNPATSDGLFVFTSGTSYPAAAVGKLVEVTGTVAEFLGATQLGNVQSVTEQGSGYTIAPVAVTLPQASDDELERYEGMLVTINGPFTVSENYWQGRYGQLTLSVGGRLETPTNRVRPGAEAQALARANDRRRLILDDGSSLQNPNPTPFLDSQQLPRAGDLITGAITGVLDFGPTTSDSAGRRAYKIHPTAPLSYAVANPRTAAPMAVGGNVKVASFNVLNYFTTLNQAGSPGCSAGGTVAVSNCRGANSELEFSRQRTKIIAALSALDADIVGLMEIQNNGNTAVQDLVNGLNAAMGAGTYATVALPADTGSDAIRVAMIYKPARVWPLGAPLSDTHPVNNRPTLAQTFTMANGERFSVLVNHLKSKGSCPAPGSADYDGNFDSGDGQGCWNLLRRQQAQRLCSFVATVQATAGSPDVLLVGDFNAYAKEDPIVVDLGGCGFVDELARFAGGANVHTYVFDGQAGRLDHALSSASLSARVTRATVWPINADEMQLADYNTEFKQPQCAGCPPDPYAPTPFRSSDHDPVLVGLDIYRTVVSTPTSATLVGSAGDDILVNGAGRRTLSGGSGNDRFVFTSAFTGGATITDFGNGADTLWLRDLLQALGVVSADPIGQGYVGCRASGADAVIQIDPDAAGSAPPRPMIVLKNRACSSLDASHFVF